jgi:predicted nuclease of predicted toxin-antitoxin system
LALLLADENIPRLAVEMLRQLGHEVKWVIEEGLQGADDDVLYNLAVSEQRVVVSFDDYFSQRTYAESVRPAGVVTLKFKPKDTQEVTDRLRDALAAVGDLNNRLIFVHRTRVRVRTLA